MESPRTQRKKEREQHMMIDNILALSTGGVAAQNPVIQLQAMLTESQTNVQNLQTENEELQRKLKD